MFRDHSNDNAFNRYVSQHPFLIALLVIVGIAAFVFFEYASQNATNEANKKLDDATAQYNESLRRVQNN